MIFKREAHLPYPQPWEFVRDNFKFNSIDPFFVDIGANDGVLCSNSGFFEFDLNWKGICIEPHPVIFKRLEENRNCILYNCCVSEIEDIVEFCAIENTIDSPGMYMDMISGIVNFYSNDHKQRVEKEIQETNSKRNIINIQSRKLDSILKENNISHVNYLSIDTEGSEYSILKSIDFDSTTIDVISSENSGNHDIKGFLKERGFKFVAKICSDEIYTSL